MKTRITLCAILLLVAIPAGWPLPVGSAESDTVCSITIRNIRAPTARTPSLRGTVIGRAGTDLASADSERL